jgi:hypothetical protein
MEVAKPSLGGDCPCGPGRGERSQSSPERLAAREENPTWCACPRSVNPGRWWRTHEDGTNPFLVAEPASAICGCGSSSSHRWRVQRSPYRLIKAEGDAESKALCRTLASLGTVL